MMQNKHLTLILVLATALCGVGYYSSHQENIFATRAGYYYKKNDMTRAQMYYEKAFDAGFIGSKERDLYVNSLINSPLDINAQEKLVKFLNYPIEDNAKEKVEYFLYDLKREIYRKYPYNYISQAVFNQKIVRWENSPITYDFVNTKDVPEYFEEEIENAFSEWEKATSHQILFSRENKNPNIIIKFHPENNVSDNSQKYVVAYTTPSIQTGRLKSMEVNFYLKDAQNEYFSNNQIYNTALHEIAHAIGFMGHSYDRDDILYLSKDSESVLKDIREGLSKADINTIKLLYKIKPDITNVDNPSGEYIPYLILGTDYEVNTSKTNEAKNYIKKAPTLPSGYIDLAESYVAAKEYPKAIKSLEKALKLADTDEVRALIYYNLAVSYYYIDHTELALEYAKFSGMIKESEELHFLLGEIYLKQKDYNKAKKEYEFLIKNEPNNIEYSIALANIYVLENKYMSARKVLKTYIEKNPHEKNNPRLKPYGILKYGL